MLTLSEKLDPRQSALLVIDVQNDFCSVGGGYSRLYPQADFSPIARAVTTIAELLEQARALGVLVVHLRTYSSTPDQRYLSQVVIAQSERRTPGLLTTLPMCEEGTWGVEILDEVTPRPNELLITKHRYSAFINTPLQAYLNDRGIRTIVATGVATQVCVESTVRDGFMLGFHAVVPRDAVGAVSPQAHEASLKVMDEFFGEVTDMGAVVAAWQGRP